MRSRVRGLVTVLAALTTIVVVGPSTQVAVEDYVFTHHGEWVGALGMRLGAEVVGVAIWSLIVLVSLLAACFAVWWPLTHALRVLGARPRRDASDPALTDMGAAPSSGTPASAGAPGS